MFWGISTLEDKLVQAGLVKILNAIYEQDFIDDSYGFRPNRNCHDALRALSQTVENKPIHYMVEADIKGFFDNVDQNQLITFLTHRIADKRVLCYKVKFMLKRLNLVAFGSTMEISTLYMSFFDTCFCRMLLSLRSPTAGCRLIPLLGFTSFSTNLHYIAL